MIDSEKPDYCLPRIMELCRSGRQIVPLVGAGISVESGIPIMSGIAHYLARAEVYFRLKLFNSIRPGDKEYSKELHLALFGYPDPYQVNAELWQKYDDDTATATTSKGPRAWIIDQ